MSVTTVMMRVLADAVAAYGVSVAELALGTAVAPELFTLPDGVVRQSDFEQLVRRAVALTGDTAFGLHWAERSTFAAFDLIGYVTAAVSTFGDALGVVRDLYPLLSDGGEFALRTDDDSATVAFYLRPSEPPVAHVREEFISATCVRLLRLFAGSSGMPSSANFTYAAPAHRAEYTRFFGGRERFEQPFTGIVVDRALLGARRLFHDTELERDLRARAESRLQRTREHAPHARRVAECLREEPFVARSSMKTIARRLEMSERSLRRHLSNEGSAFPTLRTEALSSRAKHLLAETTLPIKEVAFSLGFSAPTAFHRAFRAWTGLTPATFRAAAAPDRQSDDWDHGTS